MNEHLQNKARAAGHDSGHSDSGHSGSAHSSSGNSDGGNARRKSIAEDVAGLAEDLQATGAEAGENLKRRAESMADEKKAAGGRQMKGIARAIERAGEELEGEMPAAARYVRQAAGQVESLSDTLQNRSVEELASALNNFARTQPTAFLGASVFAGFALTRLIKASVKQQPMHAARTGSPALERDRT